MKYNIRFIILLIVTTTTFVLVALNSNLFIKNRSWKYIEGYYIGDFVNFGGDYKISPLGKISFGDSLLGKVRLIGFQKLKVTSPDGNSGYYSSK